jgi:prepilin-type N-terminal cleavage/methylation domain-containing protein
MEPTIEPAPALRGGAPRPKQDAFTLIELMVVVVILGVLAAIAIPSFIGYVRRARTSEAVVTLGAMYGAASALYVAEHSGRQVQSTVVTACVAEPNSLSPSTPRSTKQVFTAGPGFDELAFKMPDFVYYGYGFTSIGNAGGITCFANSASLTQVNTFYARGYLDEDGTRSTFELSVGANGASQLYHARGIYVANEME